MENTFDNRTSTTQTCAPRKSVLLVIMDGVGVNPETENNAVALAKTPNLDKFLQNYAHTELQTCGPAVGLPEGQMGNSEVGHVTLGSGEIIRQDMVQINQAIENGKFFTNSTLLSAINQAKTLNRPVHLVGLVSDGGVHSSLDHLLALIRLCKLHGAKPLLHMITDGRDTAPRSALSFLKTVEQTLHESGGAIASICGRYFAMDRDNKWQRTELAWRAIVRGEGQNALSAETAITAAYAAGENDEFIRPALLPSYVKPEDGDQFISFNFRKDRPKQIVMALGLENFDGFDRGPHPQLDVTCIMPYDKRLNLPYAFEPEKPANTLAEVISEAGLKQFHCAETEKYAHVTYFFNGGRRELFTGESHKLIPSPDVATYDMKPEMSAHQVADAVIEALQENEYGFVLVNFANGDMVGHTAKLDAAIHAMEILDEELGRVVAAAEEMHYSVIITADHGNCEELVDPLLKTAHTQHTLFPVPCIVMDHEYQHLHANCGLSHVAPTVLRLMGLPVPDSMESHSILNIPGEVIHTLDRVS